MKINKTKILVPALVISAGAALVGSISGTAAWFQYSTKVTASTIQMSASEQRNLKIGVNGGTKKYDLVSSDLDTRATNNKKLLPVSISNTTASDALNVADFSGQPFFGQPDKTKWSSVENKYLQFTLSFEAEVNGAAKTDLPLYITDLTLGNAGTTDIAKALRVHIAPSSSAKHYISLNGETINTFGKLDLNGDGAPDKANKYEWETAGADLVYGEADSTQTCEKAADLVATPDEKGKFAAGAKSIGTVGETYVVTVWFEGWQELATTGANWARSAYNAIDFHLGMTFAIDTELQ